MIYDELAFTHWIDYFDYPIQSVLSAAYSLRSLQLVSLCCFAVYFVRTRCAYYYRRYSSNISQYHSSALYKKQSIVSWVHITHIE